MMLLDDFVAAYAELKAAQGNCGSPRVQRAHDRMVELCEKVTRTKATPAEIQCARDNYANDDCEIDDDAQASRMDESRGGDNGVWVAAWVWIQPESDSAEGR